jgi:hypothetical protein
MAQVTRRAVASGLLAFIQRSLWRVCVLLAQLVLLWLAACKTPATEVLLVLDSNIPARRAMELRIVSIAGAVPAEQVGDQALGRVLREVLLTRQGAIGPLQLPGSVAILPTAPGVTDPVTVWLRATVAGTDTEPTVTMDRIARVRFARNATGTARVFLNLRCGDRALGCTSVSENGCTVSVRCREQGATCGDDGECVSPELVAVFGDAAVPDATLAQLDANSGRVDASDSAPQDMNDIVLTESGADGFTDAADAVDDSAPPDAAMIAAPRLIAPLSTTTAGSRRPTFRWRWPGSEQNARVELCRDRACTSVIETLSGTTSAQPTVDLPAGWVFWRARGVQNAVLGTSVSATWQLWITASRRSGADTSFGSLTDFNGDGFGDFAIGAPHESVPMMPMLTDVGAVHVSYGALGGLSARSQVLVGAEVGAYFGRTVVSAGDVNGDGYGDLAVAASFAAPGGLANAGQFAIYFGGPLGLSAVPAQRINGDATGGHLGGTMSTAGDINGDGYADFAAAAPSASLGVGNSGLVRVYVGGPLGLAAMAARQYVGTNPGDGYGTALASGDINGDGLSDLVIGAGELGMNRMAPTGAALVYLGTGAGLPMVAAPTIFGALGDGLGTSLDLADVDGDGLSDLVAGSPDASGQVGGLAVYPGAAMGFGGTLRRYGPVLAGATAFGRTVSHIGDVNNDGFEDVAVWSFHVNAGANTDVGQVNVCLGGISGLRDCSGFAQSGIESNEWYGYAIGAAGDVDGDHYSDMLVGALFKDNGPLTDAGRAQLYFGSIAGVITNFSYTFNGGAANDLLGISVSR